MSAIETTYFPLNDPEVLPCMQCNRLKPWVRFKKQTPLATICMGCTNPQKEEKRWRHLFIQMSNDILTARQENQKKRISMIAQPPPRVTHQPVRQVPQPPIPLPKQRTFLPPSIPTVPRLLPLMAPTPKNEYHLSKVYLENLGTKLFTLNEPLRSIAWLQLNYRPCHPTAKVYSILQSKVYHHYYWTFNKANQLANPPTISGKDVILKIPKIWPGEVSLERTGGFMILGLEKIEGVGGIQAGVGGDLRGKPVGHSVQGVQTTVPPHTAPSVTPQTHQKVEHQPLPLPPQLHIHRQANQPNTHHFQNQNQNQYQNHSTIPPHSHSQPHPHAHPNQQQITVQHQSLYTEAIPIPKPPLLHTQRPSNTIPNHARNAAPQRSRPSSNTSNTRMTPAKGKRRVIPLSGLHSYTPEKKPRLDCVLIEGRSRLGSVNSETHWSGNEDRPLAKRVESGNTNGSGKEIDPSTVWREGRIERETEDGDADEEVEALLSEIGGVDGEDEWEMFRGIKAELP